MLKTFYKLIKCFALFATFALLLQSCFVVKKSGSLIGGDDIFTQMTDKLNISHDNPSARYNYQPSRSDLDFVNRTHNYTRYESNYFYIATKFESINRFKQTTDRNCWAACSIMLLKHEFNKTIKISKINKMYDRLLKKYDTANDLEIFKSILTDYKTVTYKRPVTQNIIVESILSNHPIIIGFTNKESKTGHVCLLIGLYFSFDGTSDKHVVMDKIVYLDPWDGKQHIESAIKLKDEADFAISYLEQISSAGFMTFRGEEKTPEIPASLIPKVNIR